jgi:hypothetical protein
LHIVKYFFIFAISKIFSVFQTTNIYPLKKVIFLSRESCL